MFFEAIEPLLKFVGESGLPVILSTGLSAMCETDALLRRFRSGDEDELVQRGILLTMSGLATALRNSG